MGIKCSLLGHSFTGTAVEEEREEQGSEVLITVKEVETCDRCGKTRVISENKEVRSIESAEPAVEPDETPVDDEPTGTPEPAGTTPSPDIDAAEGDAELIDEAEPEEPPADPTPDPEPAADTGGTEPATATDPAGAGANEADVTGTEVAGADADAPAEEDDAVILEDDEEPEREPGEWPEDGRDGSVPADATAAAEWPEEDEGDDEEWEPSESLTSDIDSAEVEPAGGATVTVPEGEFECPECGFTTLVEESSLRAGDFCPQCHKGALEHRAEE